MLSANRIEKAIKNCRALIQQKGYSGQEGEVVNAIKTMMRHYQSDDIHVDRHGNIAGGTVSNQPGKTLALNGHIDTVSVNEEKWSRNPYGGDIEDGKAYGHGTIDTKGAVAAMTSAVGFFGWDNQRNFAGKIYVVCITYEECFEGIAARLVSERYKPDYVITGEAPELNPKIGQRSRTETVVETFGKSVHSASPQAEINAVYKMAQLIDKICTITPPMHPVPGLSILELTDIKSSSYPGASVVPGYCRVTHDRRLSAGETKESVVAPLENAPVGLIAQDPQSKARVSYAVGQESCYTGTATEGERFFPDRVYDKFDEFVQAALVGIREAGFNPTITQYLFCTNGSHYAGEVGIGTIGFGPSRENLAHTIDEYIEIDQLTGSASGYYGIIQILYRQ